MNIQGNVYKSGVPLEVILPRKTSGDSNDGGAPLHGFAQQPFSSPQHQNSNYGGNQFMGGAQMGGAPMGGAPMGGAQMPMNPQQMMQMMN